MSPFVGGQDGPFQNAVWNGGSSPALPAALNTSPDMLANSGAPYGSGMNMPGLGSSQAGGSLPNILGVDLTGLVPTPSQPEWPNYNFADTNGVGGSMPNANLGMINSSYQALGNVPISSGGLAQSLNSPSVFQDQLFRPAPGFDINSPASNAGLQAAGFGTGGSPVTPMSDPNTTASSGVTAPANQYIGTGAGSLNLGGSSNPTNFQSAGPPDTFRYVVGGGGNLGQSIQDSNSGGSILSPSQSPPFSAALLSGSDLLPPANLQDGSATDTSRFVAGGVRPSYNITLNTALPDGSTVGDLVNALVNDINNRPVQVIATPDGPVMQYGNRSDPLSVVTDVYNGTNIKRLFKGSQANPAFLGDAGNFAYGAVTARLGIPLDAAEIPARAYSLITHPSSDWGWPYGMDPSARQQIPKGYGTK